MIQSDGSFRTDDMTLAIVLACHGFNPSLNIEERRGKKIGIWVLPVAEVTEAVKTLVDEYMSSRIRVEPRRFMREARHVRHELYKFLDHQDSPRGTPIRPD